MEGYRPEDQQPVSHPHEDYFIESEYVEWLRLVQNTETLQLMFDESLTDDQLAAKSADDYKSFFSLLSAPQKAMMIELTWRRTQI